MKYIGAVSVLAGMTLLGSYVVVTSFIKWYQERQIKRNGVATQAEVTALRISPVGRGGHTYLVTYQFELNAGEQRQTRECEVSGDDYAKLELGQRLEAVYSPDAPHTSRLLIEPGFGMNEVGKVIAGLLGALVSGGGLAVLVRVWRHSVTSHHSASG